MSKPLITKRFVLFGVFRLNMDQHVLFRGDRLVPLPAKPAAVLVALVERGGQIVSKDELMQTVWADSTVDERNLAVNIGIVREVLAAEDGDTVYIETLPKRGYRFCVPVREEPTDQSEALLVPEKKRHRWTTVAVVGILFIATALGLFYWREAPTVKIGRSEINSPADTAEVRRMIREAQEFEFFGLYRNPNAFDESQLDKYWLRESLGGKEIIQIRASLDRLRKGGRRYGSEARLEQFDFTYIRILAPGDRATAGTIEKWFLPLYEKNGEMVPKKNVYFGPYPVDYTLRKANGVWLIEETTTPRARAQPAEPEMKR